MDRAAVYTVGHSTRSLDELAQVLTAARVESVVDVRSVPRSRRHPRFAREALSESLPDRGIDYRHEPHLGGFRRPRPDSPNAGWEHTSFRGYADYMASGEFAAALERLQTEARRAATCVMCAEAQWWRCHRRLISDALMIRGWTVLHLGLGSEPRVHELTSFAVVGPGLALSYPPLQEEFELA